MRGQLTNRTFIADSRDKVIISLEGFHAINMNEISNEEKIKKSKKPNMQNHLDSLVIEVGYTYVKDYKRKIPYFNYSPIVKLS